MHYSSKKLLKKLSKNKKSLLFFFIGLILFFFGGINYWRIRVLSFHSTPAVSSQNGNVPIQITIPSINIDLPINAGEIKNGVWQISYTNATWLNSSGRIGGGDNIVIYGHNKRSIFANLPYLSIGQKIYLKDSDNIIHLYEVYKKDFVNPERIDLVSITPKEELTIYTCWGIFDTQRAVIKAKPVTNI